MEAISDSVMQHSILMDNLKRKLAEVRSVLPDSAPVIYIDYPVHDNVGDLLIHMGADAFLEDFKLNVVGRFSIYDFTFRPNKAIPDVQWKKSVVDLDRIVNEHRPVIILHGGGNFGDIWPEFQKFRELIVERYSNSPIVIFPQSIHFGDAIASQRAAKIFGSHKNLHIFTRDAESFDFVSRVCSLPGSEMPDMAHQLWGKINPRKKSASSGVLTQARRDKESRVYGSVQASDFDWDDLRKPGEVYLVRGLRKWQTIDNPLRHYVSNYSLWRIYRDNLVSRAVERFRPYEEIKTDRLHGMILGALMAKKVTFGDGNYGKLHRYARSWLSGSPLIQAEADSDDHPLS